MADRYIRSTDGDDADDGSTWALAKATGAGVAAIDTAGDRLFFSDAHAESTAGNVTWALAGTEADPSRLICGDDAAEPPTAVATTGTITTTGASTFSMTGALYCTGLSFSIGDSTNTSVFSPEGILCYFENGSVQLVGSGGAGRIVTNALTGGVTVWNNFSVKFSNASQELRPAGTTSVFRWNKGSVLSGGTSPTALFTDLANGVIIELNGVDLSNCAATMDIVDNGTASGVSFKMRDCKLPASWEGELNNAAVTRGSRFEMFCSDDADTNYRLMIKEWHGAIVSETTVVKTGGASDGATTLSWLMTSNANAQFPERSLRSPEIVKWNETVGSQVTVTVDFLHDSVTNLQNDEVWLEVMYLGTSGVPLGNFATDRAASVLATTADHAASAATWTTTGLTNPNEQKLVVTFTPQEIGYIHAVVHLGVASKSIYVNPKID